MGIYMNLITKQKESYQGKEKKNLCFPCDKGEGGGINCDSADIYTLQYIN